MKGKKYITIFPRLRTVYIGPQSTRRRGHVRNGRGGRLEDSIEEALKHSTKKMCVRKSSSRAEAVRNAQVVITIGSVKRSFGKPTLNLVGELLVPIHSDLIRRFLRDTGATSVAFALTSNQPYWKVFKVIRHAFDWSRRNFCALTHEQKQEIRDLYVEGATQRQLSARFGISQPAITYIVTGYADHEYFASVRKQGFVTLNKLAEEENVYWLDADKKAVDLNIKIHKIGPMYGMIDKKDSKRLRASLQRVFIRRNKKRAKLAVGCQRGHPWTEENTGFKKGGKDSAYLVRFCRTCSNARGRAKYHRKRAG